MIRLEHTGVTIKINISNPGIYIFEALSSTGKTLLCKWFKELYGSNDPVDGYTYNDKCKGITLQQYVNERKLKVFVIDRYNMYHGCFQDYMLELAKSCIILIDYKTPNIVFNDFCSVEQTEDTIEVNII